MNLSRLDIVDDRHDVSSIRLRGFDLRVSADWFLRVYLEAERRLKPRVRAARPGRACGQLRVIDGRCAAALVTGSSEPPSRAIIIQPSASA